jgi:hypothetical protein
MLIVFGAIRLLKEQALDRYGAAYWRSRASLYPPTSFNPAQRRRTRQQTRLLSADSLKPLASDSHLCVADVMRSQLAR